MEKRKNVWENTSKNNRLECFFLNLTPKPETIEIYIEVKYFLAAKTKTKYHNYVSLRDLGKTI